MPPDDRRMNPRNVLSDDDKALLKEWRTALILQDHRYEPKALMSLVALAMADPDFRSKLVSDTTAALDEHRDRLDLPDGYEFEFHENTESIMHVVLPPRAGEVAKRPIALRRALHSRTDLKMVPTFFQDDFDYPDFHDPPPPLPTDSDMQDPHLPPDFGVQDIADPHTRDHW